MKVTPADPVMIKVKIWTWEKLQAPWEDITNSAHQVSSRHWQANPAIFFLCALTSSHLQRAVFLLQLLHRISELLPSLLFQRRAWKSKKGLEWLHPYVEMANTQQEGGEVMSCRQTGSRQVGRQAGRQVGRTRTMLSIISPDVSLNLWALMQQTESLLLYLLDTGKVSQMKLQSYHFPNDSFWVI